MMAIFCLEKTPLHKTADGGHIEVAKYLVDLSAHLNVQDAIGVFRLVI